MLGVTNSSWRSTRIGLGNSASRRRAIPTASRSESRSSQSIANSSPPKRATVSAGLTISRSRCATSTSSRSPASCPSASLTDLKRSRSKNSTATDPGRRRALARAMPRWSRNSERLGSPVSASWVAWNASRSSASFRSVISCTITPIPSTGPSSPRTGWKLASQCRPRPPPASTRSSWSTTGSPVARTRCRTAGTSVGSPGTAAGRVRPTRARTGRPAASASASLARTMRSSVSRTAMPAGAVANQASSSACVPPPAAAAGTPPPVATAHPFPFPRSGRPRGSRRPGATLLAQSTYVSGAGWNSPPAVRARDPRAASSGWTLCDPGADGDSPDRRRRADQRPCAAGRA